MTDTVSTTLRDATLRDHARVGELTVAAYDALPRAPSAAYRETLADVAARVDAGVTVIVAEIAGAVVGAVALVLDGGSYFEFEHGVDGDAGFRMLAVDSNARGRGVGAALVDECVRRARAAGRRRMVICSMDWMQAAHHIYAAAGFTRLPELDRTFGAPGDERTCRAFSLDLSDEPWVPFATGSSEDDDESDKVLCE